MGNRFSKKRCPIRSVKSAYFDKFSSYNFDKKDCIEQEHTIHAINREAFKGNFCSPIQNILSNPNAKILDVGCGSGFWLMEMAADFPKPNYVGIDKLPIFPKSTIPNNVKFFQQDFLEGLPYDDNTFDFIHIQMLIYEFTESQWENFVYKELVRLLKPGGWLEICDPEIEIMNSGPTLRQLNLAVCNNLEMNNVNPYMAQHHHSLIKTIPSFSSSDIYHEERILPLSSHASKLGKIIGQQMKSICKYAYLGPIGRDMKIKRKEIKSNLDKIEREFEIYNPYFYLHKFYVQKRNAKFFDY